MILVRFKVLSLNTKNIMDTEYSAKTVDPSFTLFFFFFVEREREGERIYSPQTTARIEKIKISTKFG